MGDNVHESLHNGALINDSKNELSKSARRECACGESEDAHGHAVHNSAFSRRALLAGAGTILASFTLPLASGPAAAFADDANSTDNADNTDSGAEDATHERIVIVHTNDVHTSLKNIKTKLGYAALMDYVNAQCITYGTDMVSLVDVGDNIQGDFEGSFTKGETPAKVIGACKYDLLTLGNHEFDYGVDQLFKLRQTEGNLPFVCCNFLDQNGNRIYDAYRILEYKTSAGSVRVAYVGVATPSTLTSSTPTSFKDKDGNYIYSFCGDATGEALYSVVQAAVDEARNTGNADYVVLLAHLGQKGSAERWRSDTLVANTEGIDVVLDGHSHEMYVQTKLNKLGQNVIIAQTGTKFASFGRVEIDPTSGMATTSLDATGVNAQLITQWDSEDAVVGALVDELEAELEEKKNALVCTSEVFLRAYEDDGSWAVRKHETNLADLVADAYLYHAANYSAIYDIALANAGGVRADINKGTVTYGNVVSVAPYMNQLCGLEVTGQHLLNMLEIGASQLPEEHGGFLQVSEGATYTVRLDLPSPVVFNEDRTAVVGFEGERRVTHAQIDGKDIDPAATYKVLSSNYILVDGGNKMPIPANADNAEFLGVDTDAIIDYLQVNLQGVIGQAYANEAGQGRIKLVDHDDSDGGSSGDSGEGDGGSSGGSEGDGSRNDAANNSDSKKSKAGLPQTGDATGMVAAAAGLVGAAAIVTAAGIAES